jgi:hypothetical protein
MLNRVRPRVMAGPVPRRRVAGPAKTEPTEELRSPTPKFVPKMAAANRGRAPYENDSGSLHSAEEFL